MSKKVINLNADFGESFYDKKIGNDEKLILEVDTINLACGFHGGDVDTIYNSIKLAIEHNKEIGAHPSYYDLENFGRKPMKLSYKQLEPLLIYQISAILALAKSLNKQVSHIKLHGALNNMASLDKELAKALAKIISIYYPDLIILNPAISLFTFACLEAGIKVCCEIFADRSYDDQGYLLDRKLEGAIVTGREVMANRMLEFLATSSIITKNNKKIPIKIDSICFHGDLKDASVNARYLRAKLKSEGYSFTTLKQQV